MPLSKNALLELYKFAASHNSSPGSWEQFRAALYENGGANEATLDDIVNLLSRTIFHDCMPAITILLDKIGNPNVIDSISNLPIIDIAAQYNRINVITELLRRRADVRLAHPLSHISCRDPNTVREIVGLLVQAGADINQGDKHGTPIHSAAFIWNTALVRELLSRGANPNLEDEDGNTPLHVMAKTTSPQYPETATETITALISAKADINKPNKSGETPLYFAVKYHNTIVIRALLAQGAYTHLTDNNGNTLMHAAATGSTGDVVEIILDLIRAGVSAKVKNKHGETPLHTAAKNGTGKTATTLLAHTNVDCREVDENGNTALHIAAKYARFTETIKCFIIPGENIDQENRDGMTPLHVATVEATQLAEKDLLMFVTVIETLLINGANPNKQQSANDHRTPLEIAAISNKATLILAFLRHDQNAITQYRGPNSDMVKKLGVAKIIVNYIAPQIFQMWTSRPDFTPSMLPRIHENVRISNAAWSNTFYCELIHASLSAHIEFTLNNENFARQITELARQQFWCESVHNSITRVSANNICIYLKPEYVEHAKTHLGERPSNLFALEGNWQNPADVIQKVFELIGSPPVPAQRQCSM